MAAEVNAAAFTFRDSQGRTSTVRMWLKADNADPTVFNTALNNVYAALTPCTNAAPQQVTLFPPQDVSYGVNAVYASIMDKAILMFQDNAGARHMFHVPAPKAAMFDVDGVTVVNTGITATLTAAITANAQSRDASPLAFLSGWLAKARNQRRTSSLVRRPSGSGQAVP